MMQEVSNNGQVYNLIASAKTMLLLTRRDPTPDEVGSILALKEALGQLGKNPTLSARDLRREKLSDVPGVETIKDELEPRSLTLVIDYTGSPVDKINYEAKDEKLYLTFTPFVNSFDPQKIEHSFSRLDYDLIFSLGAKNFEELGIEGFAYPQDLEDIPVINLDFHKSNEKYGQINLVREEATSVAEIAFALIEELGVKITSRMASMLLMGILFRTHHLQRNVSAEVLEKAARLVRSGADWQAAAKRSFKPPEQEKKETTPAPSEKVPAGPRPVQLAGPTPSPIMR